MKHCIKCRAWIPSPQLAAAEPERCTSCADPSASVELPNGYDEGDLAHETGQLVTKAMEVAWALTRAGKQRTDEARKTAQHEGAELEAFETFFVAKWGGRLG